MGISKLPHTNMFMQKEGRMNKKEMDFMLQEGESQFVEFKESLSSKDEIGENVSAFSNTNNGKIIIGVSDAGEVKGIEIGKKTMEDLANYIKQNTDNPVFPKIEVVNAPNKKIIAIIANESSE